HGARQLRRTNEVEKMKRRAGIVALLVATLFCAVTLPKLEAEEKEMGIVALGDSLTAGYGLPQSESFPAKLEAALKAQGHKIRVVNAGVSGDTASDGLARLDWALPSNQDVVIVVFVDNEACSGV